MALMTMGEEYAYNFMRRQMGNSASFIGKSSSIRLSRIIQKGTGKSGVFEYTGRSDRTSISGKDDASNKNKNKSSTYVNK